MSADHWAECPRCLQHAKTEFSMAEQQVAALYGKVSVGEFDQRRAELVPVDPAHYRTFREDYEIGVDGGALEWSYAGRCTVCDLHTEIKGRKRFWDSIALEPVNVEGERHA